MKYRSMPLALALVSLLGAGCFDPLPQTNQATKSSATSQPLSQPGETVANPRIDVLLGIQMPPDGPALYRDSSVPKQEGSLFYGQSYRLALNAVEIDTLVGRVQILNLTDPYRKPRTALNDPMRLLLGCGGVDVNYGPACDFGKPATTTLNGLNIGRYEVTYFPRGNSGKGDDASVTTTVWLVSIPQNSDAWLYVYPADLENPEQGVQLKRWLENVVPL
ncbi:MAG: hypothetical protein WC787_02240 [Patescibacteria group bacterium]